MKIKFTAIATSRIAAANASGRFHHCLPLPMLSATMRVHQAFEFFSRAALCEHAHGTSRKQAHEER